MVALALEVEDRVHQVLEDPRPRERTLLRHVTDEERGDPEPLGEHHEAGAALAYLRDAPRRGLELGQEDGLDRIHDERAGLHVVELGLDRGEVGLRPEEQAVCGDPEPLRAHLDLCRRLLRRHVQDGRGHVRERPRRLQEQRAFADARIPAHEDERAADDAAAQNAVELADAGADAVVLLQRDVAEGPGPALPGRRPPAASRRRRALLHELEVARASPQAVGTGAGFWARVPALLAAIDANVASRHPLTPRGSG